MSEHQTRSRTVGALRTLHAISVENPCLPGTPDVEFIGGWIECKQMDRWPQVPDDVPIKLKHPFMQDQRLWAKQRAKHGGRSYLLLQVGNEWLLFLGPVAARHVGYATRSQLIDNTYRYWPKGLVDTELLEAVRV